MRFTVLLFLFMDDKTLSNDAFVDAKNKIAIERLSSTSWKNPILPLSRSEKYVRGENSRERDVEAIWKRTAEPTARDFHKTCVSKTDLERDERQEMGPRTIWRKMHRPLSARYSAAYVESVIAFLLQQRYVYLRLISFTERCSAFEWKNF